MRDSDVHSDITVKRPNQTQSNYDPVLHEFADPLQGTNYIDIQYRGLVDESGRHKERWVNVVDAGKYENITFVLTLEIDATVNLTDKVLLPDGELYLVDWIYKLPYHTMYGLKKTFKNTSYNV